MNKLVSVIIPTYSRPRNLKRAIDSVLNQTYNNIEIIVVDDNGEGTPSQIETESVIEPYINMNNFYYLKHKVNRNGGAARNTGFKYSHGKYIAFLDDDDEFLPRKIEIQVNKLEQLDESWGGCYCNTNLIDKKIVCLNDDESGNLTEGILLGLIRFNSSTLLLRRSVYLKLNGFDESFIRHQDWEFMIRFFRYYKLCLPTKKHLLNRYHGKMSSSSNDPTGLEFVNIKKKFLSEFSDDIRSCNCPNNIFHKHWIDVALYLLRDREYRLFFVYFVKANSYNISSYKELKTIIVVFLHSLFRSKCLKHRH